MSIEPEWFLGMSYVILNWTALSEMVYNEIKYIDVSEICYIIWKKKTVSCYKNTMNEGMKTLIKRWHENMEEAEKTLIFGIWGAWLCCSLWSLPSPWSIFILLIFILSTGLLWT